MKKQILHLFGIHDWLIEQQVTRQGKYMYFTRVCEICHKEQLLARPLKI